MSGYQQKSHILYGTYYIKELSAPKGYELSDKVVKIEINDKGVFADEVELAEKENAYNIDFEDDIIEVVNTGDNRSIIIFAVLGTLSAIILERIGLHELKNRKNNKK